MKFPLPQIIELCSLSGLIILGDVLVQRLEQHYDSPPHPPSIPSISTSTSTSSDNTNTDTINQQGKFQLDYKRTLGMGATGLFWVGPLTMAWFPFLHRFMAKKLPNLIEGSMRYILTKMVLENLCLAGPCCFGFFVIPSKFEGDERWNSVGERMKTDFLPTLFTDLFFWTFVSPFNYKFTAVKYQPAISCMLGGVEAGGLSYITHLEGIEWTKIFDYKSNQNNNNSK